MNFKPSASLTISTGPDYERSRAIAQYVTTITDPTAQATFGSRYIFSDLNQASISMVTRANWALSPNLSFQLYAQPLISVGDYWTMKEFQAPGTFLFRRYGESGSRLDYAPAERRYMIDPDGDGPATMFTVDDPNFNFKSLRVNAVLRWEWRLGSTLFFVWTQNRVDRENPGHMSLARDVGRLFSAPGDDIFLVKLAFWLGR